MGDRTLKHYTLRDTALALLVLAEDDNAARASRDLHKHGLDISERTLRHWRAHTWARAYRHLRHGVELQDEYDEIQRQLDIAENRLDRGMRPAHYLTKLTKLTERQLDVSTEILEHAATTAPNRSDAR